MIIHRVFIVHSYPSVRKRLIKRLMMRHAIDIQVPDFRADGPYRRHFNQSVHRR
jgi:hypothetical protein